MAAHTLTVAASLVALAATAACNQGGRNITFNQPATAPATSPAAPLINPSGPGTSTVRLTGEVNLDTTSNFFCTLGLDDHFVRGAATLPDGSQLHLSIEVDTIGRPKPGVHRGTVRILVRRVVGEYYASWYHDTATMTVHPRGGGADLPTTVLLPEPGTDATKEIVMGGHFGCVDREEIIVEQEEG